MRLWLLRWRHCGRVALGWAGLCGVFALCLGLNRPGFLLGHDAHSPAFLIAGSARPGSTQTAGSRAGAVVLKAMVFRALDRRTRV